MGILDFLLLTAVAAGLFLALRKILRDKKQGKCCGSCTGCGAACPHRPQ